MNKDPDRPGTENAASTVQIGAVQDASNKDDTFEDGYYLLGVATSPLVGLLLVICAFWGALSILVNAGKLAWRLIL